jgi:hypothetical protein
VNKLAMVFLVIMRVLLSHPRFEMWDVTLEIRHPYRPYKPLFLLEGFLIPPFAAFFVAVTPPFA